MSTTHAPQAFARPSKVLLPFLAGLCVLGLWLAFAAGVLAWLAAQATMTCLGLLSLVLGRKPAKRATS